MSNKNSTFVRMAILLSQPIVSYLDSMIEMYDFLFCLCKEINSSANLLEGSQFWHDVKIGLVDRNVLRMLKIRLGDEVCNRLCSGEISSSIEIIGLAATDMIFGGTDYSDELFMVTHNLESRMILEDMLLTAGCTLSRSHSHRTFFEDYYQSEGCRLYYDEIEQNNEMLDGSIHGTIKEYVLFTVGGVSIKVMITGHIYQNNINTLLESQIIGVARSYVEIPRAGGIGNNFFTYALDDVISKRFHSSLDGRCIGDLFNITLRLDPSSSYEYIESHVRLTDSIITGIKLITRGYTPSEGFIFQLKGVMNPLMTWPHVTERYATCYSKIREKLETHNIDLSIIGTWKVANKRIIGWDMKYHLYSESIDSHDYRDQTGELVCPCQKENNFHFDDYYWEGIMLSQLHIE
jgi:hypothetical protein